MIKPGMPENERERQKEVEKYQILDTLPEESYDSITSLMAYICEVPISLVSILDKDRNYLKSHHGVPMSEDPRERSFCGHTILSDDGIMIVPDASKDERFVDNPLVTEMGVRFYAGAPLINPNGYKLGTLCVFDMQPKDLNEKQVKALTDMSKHVMIILEERYKNINLLQLQKDLVQRNEQLKKFAYNVSHDLKSPLTNIMFLAEILADSLEGNIDDKSLKYIQKISNSGESLANYINGMLEYYKSDELLAQSNQQIYVKDLFSRIERVFSAETDIDLQFHTNISSMQGNPGALEQILVNLITNGIKYNSNEKPTISVGITQNKGAIHFEVKDNGDGMDASEQENIFELFETNQKIDRFGNKGSGIGLSTVKKIIENLGGTIRIQSVPQEGTTFVFTL